MRKPGAKGNGADWTRDEIRAVWERAAVDSVHDSRLYRKDACGSWIQFCQHGNLEDQYGWGIEHIVPVAKGGTDDLSNLRPLNWKNHRGMGGDGHQESGSIR